MWQKHSICLKVYVVWCLCDTVYRLYSVHSGITMRVFAEMRRSFEVLTLGGSKWKSDKPGALVYFTYSVALFHILPGTAGLFSSRVHKATLFHFFRKLFRRISIFGCYIWQNTISRTLMFLICHFFGVYIKDQYKFESSGPRMHMWKMTMKRTMDLGTARCTFWYAAHNYLGTGALCVICHPWKSISGSLITWSRCNLSTVWTNSDSKALRYIPSFFHHIYSLTLNCCSTVKCRRLFCRSEMHAVVTYDLLSEL